MEKLLAGCKDVLWVHAVNLKEQSYEQPLDSLCEILAPDHLWARSEYERFELVMVMFAAKFDRSEKDQVPDDREKCSGDAEGVKRPSAACLPRVRVLHSRCHQSPSSVSYILSCWGVSATGIRVWNRIASNCMVDFQKERLCSLIGLQRLWKAPTCGSLRSASMSSCGNSDTHVTRLHPRLWHTRHGNGIVICGRRVN